MGGAHCAAVGCTNNRQNCKYSFFSLPKDKKLAAKWKAKVKRDKKLPKDENFYLCELHFETQCIERDMQSELLKIPVKKLD